MKESPPAKKNHKPRKRSMKNPLKPGGAQQYDCLQAHERIMEATIRRKTLKIRRHREIAWGRRRAQRAHAIEWGAGPSMEMTCHQGGRQIW